MSHLWLQWGVDVHLIIPTTLCFLDINKALTITTTKVESNINIHGCSSLIWYTAGINSLFIATKVTYAPDLDSSRSVAEGEEGIKV